ncbi:sulfite exporter TauE/SafE family protein [Aquimarina sp. ERC-38]|uniref:sulfite exporter TauE/SafE family protein n=1 Tax=Aquimarina sp. ERC-38 TaxID=2949996 RepID=UPI0022454137|nr:sulfite exporter TauE/SafE family protein [Aquimarina sp. ERC-38]UZO80739.1 sulfite exporter TauE/SafE family protein [Aquimarina sp. ERC-38]
MDFTTIASLVVIGLIAGFLSGTMGIGGSVVMIPLLVLWLSFTQHEAQGTSLAVLSIPVTLLAAFNYYKEGYVNLKFAVIIAITFIIGGYLGSKFAISINQLLLKRIFGIVLLIVAARMIFSKP